ncbi:hypothetical protein HK099_003649 [Clydaea vesicula]|uniref:Uncharacterized protein n=1 Tax=Clydaea vesicula TaxID=447962 RepID=A0AAD5XW49_9FUNG|nr:hypothetical protein HK099_003649 [Clydaea vesicula]
MAHPNDYKPVNNFESSLIINDRYGKHKRLIARIAWKTQNGNFIPMSFVCDTGVPSSFYLSSKAIEILEEYSLLKLDDKGVAYVTVHKDNSGQTFNTTMEETPKVHKNANIVGLKVLLKIGLHISNVHSHSIQILDIYDRSRVY